MRTTGALICGSTLLMASCTFVQAWPAPAPASAPAPAPAPAADAGAATQDFTVRLVSGQLEIRDARNNAPILVPRGAQIARLHELGIVSRMDMAPASNGADVRVTFTNTTSEPKKLGYLSLGIFTLGEQIEYFDFRETSKPVAAEWGSYIGQAWKYPGDMYSPVWVMRNQEYAVGVSVQCPILEYQHDIRIGMANPRGSLMEGEGGRGWLVNMLLGNQGDESSWSRLTHEAYLQPGESRDYTVSVRITRNPQEWQYTLLPYRDYFREMYGEARYERRTDPILAFGMADVGNLGPTNPRGYRAELRPDQRGWGPTAERLRRIEGWPAIMLWTPSGLYNQHRELNYPFQFASPLASTPTMATAFDPVNGLPSLPRSGTELGMWWGRATQYMGPWDASSFAPFDPQNPVHHAAAIAEMDAAVRAGSTLIGLDTFSHEFTPLWKLYPWLEELTTRYPNVRFCTEPSVCDILHTLAPTFISAWTDAGGRPRNMSDLYGIKNPNYLADLILPGHEFWAGWIYNNHRRFFNFTPSQQDVMDDMQYFADYGYVPVVFWETNMTRTPEVAPTWETSLPLPIIANDPVIRRLMGTAGPAVPTPGQPLPGSPGSLGGGSGGGSGTGTGGTGTGGTGGQPPIPPAPPAPPAGGSGGESGGGSGGAAGGGAGGGGGSGGGLPNIPSRPVFPGGGGQPAPAGGGGPSNPAGSGDGTGAGAGVGTGGGTGDGAGDGSPADGGSNLLMQRGSSPRSAVAERARATATTVTRVLPVDESRQRIELTKPSERPAGQWQPGSRQQPQTGSSRNAGSSGSSGASGASGASGGTRTGGGMSRGTTISTMSRGDSMSFLERFLARMRQASEDLNERTNAGGN